MNVSEYARYFSASAGVCSGLEADVGPVSNVILCLIKADALGVELSSPLHAVLLRALLGDASLGDSCGGDLFPWVGHWFSKTVQKVGLIIKRETDGFILGYWNPDLLLM